MKIQCETFGPRLSAYFDGELEDTERYEVQEHVETCYLGTGSRCSRVNCPAGLDKAGAARAGTYGTEPRGVGLQPDGKRYGVANCQERPATCLDFP